VNYGLAKYYFLKDNKDYNLDSANLFIKRAASKIPLPPDDKQTKKFLGLGVRDYTIKALQQEINQSAYAVAEHQHSVESYQHFLDLYTDSGLIFRATSNRNQLAYIRARGANNPDSLYVFMQKYPQADQLKDASVLFEKLRYEQTTADGTYQSYKKYIDLYPTGTYIPEARQKYDSTLLAYYNNRHDLAGYLEFEKNYKRHPAFNAIEDSIYTMVTYNGTIDAFKNFIDNYPQNRNYNDAWLQFYLLYTAADTEGVYRKFEQDYPGFPNKSRIARDIEWSKMDLQPFKQGGKVGYVIQPRPDSLVSIIPLEYEEGLAFKEGLAAVRVKPCTDEKCEYYYIDKGNNRAFDGVFNYAGLFENGYAIVGVGNCEADSCRYGMIDKRGHWMIRPLYEDLDDPSNNLFLASKDGRYGYLNKRGDVVISFKYTDAIDFSDGIAGVALDSNWFFIDTTGKQLFLEHFQDVSSFKEGMCAVTADGDNWGYIDTTGNFVIQPDYEDADDFSGGVAIVSKKEKDIKHKGLFISQRYKIDTKGKVLEKLTAPKEPSKKGKEKRKNH
ncbi:MAG TPA: WG repeat-containing protein, partial [Chitinophagales bacterium]|nr:WG repeat-containing protein [Chitinophagales bacterium]